MGTNLVVKPEDRTVVLQEIADQKAAEGKSSEEILSYLRDFYVEYVAPHLTEDARQFDDGLLEELAENAFILASAAAAMQENFVDAASVLQKAIADKDKSQLLTIECVRHLVTLKRSEPIQYAVAMSTIKETFGKNINHNDLNRAIGQEQRKQEMIERGQKPDVADVAEKWACEHQDTWAYDETAQCWRMWNGTYWEAQADKSSFLDQYAVLALQEAQIAVNSSQVLNLFHRLAAGRCRRVFIQPPMKVNFLNGTLDTDTMTLINRHQREDNFTYCLPYNYDPHSPHQAIDAFLKETITYRNSDGELVPDYHAIQCYMAHVGLALLGDTLMNNCLIQIGPTRAGKSNLLMLANAVCGAENRDEALQFAGASIFSRDVEGKRARYKWGTRRIVCADEVASEALRDEEIFKMMTAHGGTEMRGIGKDEDMGNAWKPKLIVSTNDTPHYKDVSGAIKQRAIIIPCKNGPRPEKAQKKTLFDEKLLPEVGAFAVTCIAYALAVLKQGYYPRSAYMKRTLDRIARGGNPLKSHLAERCVLSPKAKVSRSDFYRDYTDYCKNNGNEAMGFGKLQSTLDDMNLGITYKKVRIDGLVVWGFAGVGLRNVNDPLDEDDEDEQYQNDELILLTAVDTMSTKMSTATSASDADLDTKVDKVDNFQGNNALKQTLPCKDNKGKGISLRERVDPENCQFCQPEAISPHVGSSHAVDNPLTTMSTASTGLSTRPAYPLFDCTMEPACKGIAWHWKEDEWDWFCGNCLSPSAWTRHNERIGNSE